MKKEQLVDWIGEAPESYVKDAKAYKKKRKIPRWSKWISGLAAVLAVVILVNNLPSVSLFISAKAVSNCITIQKNGASRYSFRRI